MWNIHSENRIAMIPSSNKLLFINLIQKKVIETHN